MKRYHFLGVVIASFCCAQNKPPSPGDIQVIQSALVNDLRGGEDAGTMRPRGTPPNPRPELIELQPPTPNSPAGVVSVAQLKHNPPKKVQQAVARGIQLSNAAEHQEAAKKFEEAVAGDSDYANAHDRLGVEYALLGRRDEALTEFQRSLALDGNSWVGHYDLAVFLFEGGDFRGAEQSVRRSLALSRNNASAHLLLGLLLSIQSGAQAEAATHLRYAARTLPKAKELLTRLEQK